VSSTATTPTVLRFSVPISPVGKARARVFADKQGNIIAATPQATKAAERAVARAFAAAYPGHTPHAGPVCLGVVAVCSIPKSWPKWQREAAAAGLYPHVTRPDADNIAKLVGDALRKVAYAEDTQIDQLTATKVYGEHERIDVFLVLKPMPTRISIDEAKSWREANPESWVALEDLAKRFPSRYGVTRFSTAPAEDPKRGEMR
jgi:Holliday junction resolvase RusA-like endonuclease